MGDQTPTSLPQSVIIHQDNSTFPTSIVLDETNFSLWSQLMEMRIGARNKIGFLTGEKVKPTTNDPSYATWITDNNRVKSWLIDSMSPHLMQRFIRLATAKEIWEAIAKTFYDGSDETCLFELNKKSFTAKQNGRPLSTFYNELVEIFQEINHRIVAQEEAVVGVIHTHSIMARLRVHIFLNGLDAKFDQVRGEILRNDPKLDLESTYAYVRREFQQRQTMGTSRPIPESSAMAVHRKKGHSNSSSGKSNDFICNHCGEKGHSKQRCYEIIGYPDWWDFSKKPRQNINVNVSMAMQGHHRSTQEEKSQPIANVVHPGISGKVDVFSVTTKNSAWIIDTGATDHMTNDSTKLQTFKSSSQSDISTANGSTSPITGEGSIVLSNTLTLDTVLDILTRRTLGYGVKRNELYYLELTEDGKKQFHHAFHTSGVEKTRDSVWLWHRRLGHISFAYLKKLRCHDPSLGPRRDRRMGNPKEPQTSLIAYHYTSLVAEAIKMTISNKYNQRGKSGLREQEKKRRNDI
ncbi:hypothetical protein KY284_012822 [Solanum tuberosum]|nr:hypothetical protein KY284_012822 [Solanum tuberosum]